MTGHDMTVHYVPHVCLAFQTSNIKLAFNISAHDYCTCQQCVLGPTRPVPPVASDRSDRITVLAVIRTGLGLGQ
jgi:hypothetical protein